jgi:hypothetical protein
MQIQFTYKSIVLIIYFTTKRQTQIINMFSFFLLT